MTKEERKAIRKDICDWFESFDCGFDVALTLSFKHEPYRDQQAKSAFKHFMNQLHAQCYGRKWKNIIKADKRKQIAVIPILENKYGKGRLHYHCVIAKPENISHWDFATKIGKSWDRCAIGGRLHNDYTPTFNKPGWSKYITKELCAGTFDKIDVENMYVY